MVAYAAILWHVQSIKNELK